MTQNELIPKLERAISELPAFPKSVQRVIEMSSSIDCMPRDLVDILEKDPVLTGRILNLVNSSYFALARRVNSIRHALVYLGLNTIKHMAMGLAAVGAMPKVNQDGQSMGSFQSEALACGEVTRIAGRHLLAKGPVSDQLYLLGLFHNLGEVLCAVYATKEWTQYISKRDEMTLEQWDSLARELFGATPRSITSRVLNLQAHLEATQMPDQSLYDEYTDYENIRDLIKDEFLAGTRLEKFQTSHETKSDEN